MKWAIISDVHANPYALRKVLEDAGRMGAVAFACLGDTVGYGPEPGPALRKVREICAGHAVAGNNDAAVCRKMRTENFAGLAADAVRRHRGELSRDDIAYLAGLPYTMRLDGCAICAHGDIFDPEKFYYIETAEDAAANFAKMDCPVLFVGHTHVPKVFVQDAEGRIAEEQPGSFALREGCRYIVNAGSVGYPKQQNGTCQSTYVLYDQEKRTVEYRAIPFDVSSVMERTKRSLGRTAALAAAAVLTSAALLSAAALFMRGQEEPPAGLRQHAASLPIYEKEIEIPFGAELLRPNLKLAPGSPAVTLKVEFLGPKDSLLWEKIQTVRKSANQKTKIPRGAVRARLSVLKQSERDIPLIHLFEPAAR